MLQLKKKKLKSEETELRFSKLQAQGLPGQTRPYSEVAGGETLYATGAAAPARLYLSHGIPAGDLDE